MRAIALAGTLLVLASSVVAQPAPERANCPVRTSGESDASYLHRVDDRCACPVKYRGETQVAFLVRTRPVCEVRWQDKVQAGTTGAETHEHFLNRCARRCAVLPPDHGAAVQANNNGQYIVGGAALALIVAGGSFAALSSTDTPASP